MKHNQDELKKAEEFYRTNYNSLSIEKRKALFCPYDRWLENQLAIVQAKKHLAKLQSRKNELERWMLEWYREQIKKD